MLQEIFMTTGNLKNELGASHPINAGEPASIGPINYLQLKIRHCMITLETILI
jgi:hypothetical protein